MKILTAIARTAARLCDAHDAQIYLVEGASMRLVAQHGSVRTTRRLGELFPVSRGAVHGRAVLTRRAIHVRDLKTAVRTQYPELTPRQRATGTRTILAAPLLSDGAAVGVIMIRRVRVNPFTSRQIALLNTFADQAVIAIENVRLFKELEEKNRALAAAHEQVTEALEQQTATSEILRVISSSPTDLQPVFDTIAHSAARLCQAAFATLHRFDGQILTFEAQHGMREAQLEQARHTFPEPAGRHMAVGRAVLDRRPAHIHDIREDQEYLVRSHQEDYRTVLAVPLMREGVPVGALGLWRREVQPFSDQQIELVKTFAAQAVIAIENVRLFKELEARNRDLTRALEQQTATSEILAVISSSPTDVQPTFNAIAANAARLCGAVNGIVFRFDGELIHLVASHNVGGDELDAIRRVFPIRPGRGSVTARAILTRAIAHVEDLTQDPEYAYTPIAQAGFRTVLAVPMLRDGVPIGAIVVTRMEVAPFSESQIELLATFARQAVIAVENVRLFQELQARTHDLGRSVEELKALGDVSRAVSSTLDLETVLSTIVARAVQLSAASGGGVIYEYDDVTEEFRVRATHGMEPPLSQALHEAPLRLGEGAMGQAGLTRAPVQSADIRDEHAVVLARARPVLAESGYRSLLAVPLLLEQRIMGGLVVWRRESGLFDPDIVNLLQTFATQSALAIQNARLFREIEDKSRELEAASQHKSEFLANMSHELRTPLNAILGFSEVLAQGMFGAVNDKQTEYLHDILESGRHLLSLINDILDLSKIEAGRMELELTDFDLPQAIQNALTLVRGRALRRGIALHHVIDDRVADIRADERKVKQVLLNLLSNAIKFTPEGGRIDVRAAPADGLIEVSVADSGVGIAPEDQEAVFEEFRQVGTPDKKAEGTGLGLTLSRKFIELHGGKIWVQSEVGRGSTFTFTLPVSPWPAS